MAVLRPLLLILLWAAWWRLGAAQPYYAYVAAESEDEVALISFDGTHARVEKTIEVGSIPTEIEGPHGLTVSRDGRFWYLSLAHGQPYGRLIKYATRTDHVLAAVELGLFPATMQESHLTGLVYVANFDLHGDGGPGTISIVEPTRMIEIGRTTTGSMPHGSRLSPGGDRHYSVAMMSGELFEIDARTFAVSRRMPTHSEAGSKPTWVEPHPHRELAYVANNGNNEIVEVDLIAWKASRRMSAPGAPYNLGITPDGRYLFATLKAAAATAIFDLDAGREIARIANSRQIPHGIAITADGAFAFVSVEGVGAQPGAVDILDIREKQLIAVVETGRQAGGIAIWNRGG